MSLRSISAIIMALALLGAGGLGADSAELGAVGALSGRVSSVSSPLASSSVYVYELAEASLRKVVTDPEGNFFVEQLPAGLYKVIAFKSGFLPTVALITRATAEARQFLDLELIRDRGGDEAETPGFWSVRRQIPGDVLRDIERAEAAERPVAPSVALADPAILTQLQAEMQALAGMEQRPDLGPAVLTGGRVGIRGAIRDVQIGLLGDFRELQGSAPDGLGLPGARSQLVALDLDTAESTGLRLTTLNNEMTLARPLQGGPSLVNFERHRVDWSQPIGEDSRSDFSAQYTEQSNFYRRGPIDPAGVPAASRSWRLEGSYTTAPTARSMIEAGFLYRERESLYVSDVDFMPQERVDLFGRGGLEVRPAVLVEFGLYSTLRDGSLSLAPTGGVVLQLGDNWRAFTSGSFRAHEQDVSPLYQDFTPEYFGDFDDCRNSEAYCYRVLLARSAENGEDISLGAIHRRFADTLQLYFNQDFLSQLETLFMVRGDSLPELQFALTRRLAPQVLTRLESNLAAGGGGILFAAEAPYENEVRYVVTSLDTRFEQTSTGVFLAFHHLAQQLNPLQPTAAAQAVAPELEMERLQLMLTQDLGVLRSLASDWVLHLNMELSRGSSPQTIDSDELSRRLTGGLAVKF